VQHAARLDDVTKTVVAICRGQFSFPSTDTQSSSFLLDWKSPRLTGAESHSNGPTFLLENILGNDHDKQEHPDIRSEG
jgi:hypothetical protein